MTKPDNLGVTAYIPPCPAMLLDGQVRHARGFARGVCRDDHHTARLLEQLADSIEALAKLTPQPSEITPPPISTWEAGQKFKAWLLAYVPLMAEKIDQIHVHALKIFAETVGAPQAEVIEGRGQAVTFETAWNEVERLIQVNARHRKGFRLQEIKNHDFVLRQAAVELQELSEAQERSDSGEAVGGREVMCELADVLGVLFHFAIRTGQTPDGISRTMLAKFKQRFTEEPPRQSFVAPPKPELVLVRWRSTNALEWLDRNKLSLSNLCHLDVIDPQTGEPVAERE